MREETKRGFNGPLIAILVVSLVMLPLLYILSVGPAAFIYDRLDDNSWQAATLSAIYAPLAWVCERSEQAEQMISWYMKLWGSG